MAHSCENFQYNLHFKNLNRVSLRPCKIVRLLNDICITKKDSVTLILNQNKTKTYFIHLLDENSTETNRCSFYYNVHWQISKSSRILKKLGSIFE